MGLNNNNNSNANKRKLNDFAADQVEFSLPSAVRMRKDQNLPPTHIQFFVRLFPGGKTLVIQADGNDSVESVHENIMLITGIPAVEQRLIYRGKQLHQWKQTLPDCGIQKDASLELVGRMRSTGHPKAWQLINDLISLISGI
ncbi:ubiquitin-like [Nicotiana tomentosiformis]|uniref:ubiquitin-like n=1 Tax=Nicotiana tomentosiformis TaxID=4098 RepID=UPI0008780E59|nr:polyubiquitin-like [Nicotiana tomentosiformis]